MDGAVAGVGVALGLVCGPGLAALSLVLVHRWPRPRWGLLTGRGASPARRLLATGSAGVVFGLLGGTVGGRPELAAYWLFGAAAVVLAVIDVEHHRLPDRVVLPAIAGGVLLLAAALLAGAPAAALGRALLAAGAVVAGLFLLVLAHPAGLGLGDVKLGALLGLYLGWWGWSAVLAGLLAGFVLGSLAALALIAGRRASWRTPIPFGPALLAGAIAVIAVSAAAETLP